MTHDKTPWTRNWNCILDADGRVLAAFEDGGPRKGERATYQNAARAVACVNACEGIKDPAATLAEVRAALAADLGSLGIAAAVLDGHDARHSADMLRMHARSLRAALALLTPKE
jgi:hypothetical protein